MMLLVGALVLASAALVGLIGVRVAEAALVDRVEAQLTALREVRAAQIGGWFERVRGESATLARNPAVRSAARSLADAYREADPDALRRAYLDDNPFPAGQKQRLDDAPEAAPAYRAAHAAEHPALRDFQQLFGFYDLFLVGPEADGFPIFYSVFKEADFATRLLDGPYAGSGLADAVAAAAASGQAELVDFRPYAPSHDAPAAFLALPLGGEEGPEGPLLAVQMPITGIDEVMTGGGSWRESGLGESGETYLVGPDLRLRSNSRFFLEDPAGYAASLPAPEAERLRRFGTTVLLQGVDTAASRAAAAGEAGTGVVLDYRGVPVFSAYRPAGIGGLGWSVLAEIDEAEALAPVRAYRRTALLATAAVSLASLLVAFWLARGFARPIEKLADAADRLGGGDLSARVELGRKDEIGRLGERFNAMAGSLRQSTAELEVQNRENERLLLNVLPSPIADRLRGGEGTIADDFADVAVLFGDIVGFTTMASAMPPSELVGILDDVFGRFDRAAARLGVEKIKTIGDSYMAVCGLPEPRDGHVDAALDLALEMIEIVEHKSEELGVSLRIRLGVHRGPVVAGVIGHSKFIYDLWGDTVNVAARMESHGVPGAVHTTAAVAEHLPPRFRSEPRGVMHVKGKGEMPTYLVTRAG